MAYHARPVWPGRDGGQPGCGPTRPARGDVRCLGEHILQPVQRPNEAHCLQPGPIKSAGCGKFEVDLLAAQFVRLEPRIDKYLDARRHGGGEAGIVGGGHTLDDGTCPVAAVMAR